MNHHSLPDGFAIAALLTGAALAAFIHLVIVSW